MKRTHIWITIFFTNIFLTFAGCGVDAPENNDATTAINAGNMVPVETAPMVFVPKTESEFRQEIVTLTSNDTALPTDAATLATLQDYYEKLLAMDVFTEKDYVALAAVYAAQGMQEAQADMLTKAHRLYPSAEHVDALSALIWDNDTSDTQVQTLVEQMLAAIESEDQTAAAALITSEDWKNQLQNELVGVVTKTRYTADGQTTYITSDSFATEVMSLSDDGAFSYFKTDSQGSTFVNATSVEGKYQGNFSIALFDVEGDLVKCYEGTLENDICVGELQITYSGTAYTGKFDEQGHALADQISSVNKDGGVVYAYNKNKTAYLYEKNVSVDTFTIDSTYLNLPLFKEW